jgi:hypothetical protein
MAQRRFNAPERQSLTSRRIKRRDAAGLAATGVKADGLRALIASHAAGLAQAIQRPGVPVFAG